MALLTPAEIERLLTQVRYASIRVTVVLSGLPGVIEMDFAPGELRFTADRENEPDVFALLTDDPVPLLGGRLVTRMEVRPDNRPDPGPLVTIRQQTQV